MREKNGGAASARALAQRCLLPGRANTHPPPPPPSAFFPRSYNGYFVDLYVRVGNTVAVRMYHALGYYVHQRVVGYYGSADGEPAEDALDMRKGCSRQSAERAAAPGG